MAFTDFNKASLVAQMVKDLPTKQETRVQSLGLEDPLEKGMTQFSSVQSLSHVQFFATPWTAAHQASLVAQMVKNLPVMQETQVQSLSWEDPLEEEVATHSSNLVLEIPWIEEPGEL